MVEDVQRHSVHTLVFRSLKRSHDMFLSNQGLLPPVDEQAYALKLSSNILMINFLQFPGNK